MNELKDVRVVYSEDTHLGSSSMASRCNGTADSIEDIHKGDRPTGLRPHRLNSVSSWSEGREVIANSPSHPHSLTSFLSLGHNIIEGVVDCSTNKAVPRSNRSTCSNSSLYSSSGHEPLVHKYV